VVVKPLFHHPPGRGAEIGIGLRDEDFLSLYDQQARVAGLVLDPEG